MSLLSIYLPNPNVTQPRRSQQNTCWACSLYVVVKLTILYIHFDTYMFLSLIDVKSPSKSSVMITVSVI